MRHFDRLATLCTVLIGLILLRGCATTSTKAPSGLSDETLTTQNDCAIPVSLQSKFFPHSKTEEPDADAFEDSTQCNFHLWAWQAFLWLTQDYPPGSGQPRFLSFTTPNQLFPDSDVGVLSPRMGKSQKPETLDEFLQAGTDGIMTDQTGRPLYYSQYVDPNFVDFVTTNGLTDPKRLLEFDSTKNFPNGTMELKVSWKVVHATDDTSRFFTMNADVYPLANRRGTIVIDTTSVRSETLALVGFHVVGRVQGHPEMIWATFEHKDNAPDIFTYQNIHSPIGMEETVSITNHTFYAANTLRRDCNINTASSPVRKLDEVSQKITPITQVCRRYEYGNLPSDTTFGQKVANSIIQNDGNVASLNAHVLSKLGADDVWSNYYEVGAIWFNKRDALEPDKSFGDLCVDGGTDCVDSSGARLIGSLRLSNSTIETFTQSASAMENCFRCHNTSQRFHLGKTALPGKNINISHIIVNAHFRADQQ